ncbi:MAG: nucleotidyltransferase domain-containing protein [Thermoprotei archaeon]|nr:MAG: nucleotidyltransferase domain-containing protein [Thermoprotei archaeon]
MLGEKLTLIELKLETLGKWKKYFEKPELYAKKMKEIVRKYDKQARVMLFGSIVKGRVKPDSDIDIMVVTRLAEKTDDRIKLRVEIAKKIGEYTPFEVHIVTPEEYNGWYRKFIDKYIEI